jgi:hypothetical protein
MCQTEKEVRNIIQIDLKAPVKGTGWGCVVCNLPPDGAIAILCDRCTTLFLKDEKKLIFVCEGYAGDNKRILKSDLEPGFFGHNYKGGIPIDRTECDTSSGSVEPV